MSSYERELFVHLFKKQSRLITITHVVSVCRDPNDNMFLELALSGKAEGIVTSDPDLLVLNPFEHIAIVTPNGFLENF
ncbi:MAG TPA: putative toxin-antitoxin system toxin component, PIN family [Cyclobacteriaceae bacterium]|nr:putative toxin-antitoxin system toxin component, PIN family [Cyclobacteriaceae bacterium]